ncbi:carboxyl transferase domain-containing protein, partial [Streptomyces sp. NPDC058964]|uniref:carboxyl transferase domain-containing protein n=1 Tax=Streptomyces sp. NPDC058964 TaxID=3346681 RepID=UPI003683F20F
MTVTEDTTSLAPMTQPPPRPDPRSRVALLGLVKQTVREGPGPRATEQQWAKGKLTVHERLELLFDKGSFQEIEPLRRHRATGFGLENKRPYTDGVVTGWGTVEGRTVFVYAHDFRIFGGALREPPPATNHNLID